MFSAQIYLLNLFRSQPNLHFGIFLFVLPGIDSVLFFPLAQRFKCFLLDLTDLFLQSFHLFLEFFGFLILLDLHFLGRIASLAFRPFLEFFIP